MGWTQGAPSGTKVEHSQENAQYAIHSAGSKANSSNGLGMCFKTKLFYGGKTSCANAGGEDNGKGRANQEDRRCCKETQLTICNRQPTILLLDLELALRVRVRVVLFLVHLLLLFARLNFRIHLRVLRGRGRRHGF